MKTKLHVLIAMLLTVSVIRAQEVTVNTSMGAGYADQVFYKLSTETATTVAANSWDIAMLRTSSFDIGLRVNDGVGITVYEASNDPNDWDVIDIEDIDDWTELYNSDTEWNTGAFDNGSATYGFGEYNPSTHHVEGTVIFVLEYADGTYRKFINEDVFSGYTFKYSTWHAEAVEVEARATEAVDLGGFWGPTETVTVLNTSNPDHMFNYYSFENNSEVTVAPAISDWDLKFTKYVTEVPAGEGGATVPYSVTGVLVNEGIEVAVNEELDGPAVDPVLTYTTAINTIGYDWKELDFETFSFVVDQHKIFYVKYADGTIYRLYFTSFAGSSTGDLEFKFENISEPLSLDVVSNDVSFEVYPNPSSDKQINLIYDVNKLNNGENNVAIYSTTGEQVFQTSLQTNSGFYNKNIDLSSLRSGIYILKFVSGNNILTKKLVLN